MERIARIGVLSLSLLASECIASDMLAAEACHDAVLGEVCYNDTIWAKDYAIHTVPEWYPGLTSDSSFADFQAHLHHCYWNRCPLPCAPTDQLNCTMMNRFWDNSTCEDVDEGSACHIQVTWAMTHGIQLHPEWYPTLSEDSSFEEFQARLFHGEQSGLENNDCPEPCCHDSAPGELCHLDTVWAMEHGINQDDMNHIYPPTLTNTSEFAEFQAYLHLCYPNRCPQPCRATEVEANYHGGSMDCPDERRAG